MPSKRNPGGKVVSLLNGGSFDPTTSCSPPTTATVGDDDKDKRASASGETNAAVVGVMFVKYLTIATTTMPLPASTIDKKILGKMVGSASYVHSGRKAYDQNSPSNLRQKLLP